MEENIEVDDAVLDEFIIEQEEPQSLKVEETQNASSTAKKRTGKKSNADKKPKKKRKKTTKTIKPVEKRTIMKRKKSFVKAKANSSVMVVNCDTENENEFICYPETNLIHEDSNGENEDPMGSDDDANDYVAEIYVNNHEINLVEEDEKMVENYLSKDCCRRRCNLKFKTDELLRYRIELQCLDYNENGVNQLDLVLLGLIHSLCRISNEIRHSRTVEVKDRRRIKMMFGFRGVSVCRAMFMFAHGIKIERLKRLIKHYKIHGVSPKAHGNYKRVPTNAISDERMNQVISFLKQYADENGTVVKGRSTYKNQDIKILPAHETKTRVFNKYKQICQEQNSPCISVVSFRRLWNRYCPNVLIQRSSPQGKSSDVTEETVEELIFP